MQTNNYVDYLKSISQELDATKNRVRHLIRDRHWLADGEHKEAVLRRVLRDLMPVKIGVCHGFIVDESKEPSSQIDILLIDKLNKPTLFKDGDLTIVTPDCALGIVEVKTKISSNAALKSVCEKLIENKLSVFEKTNRQCPVSLFVYEDTSLSDAQILETLHDVANRQEHRAINYLSVGKSKFYRFWHHGQYPYTTLGGDSFWHSYHLENLAQAYFISNLVWDISGQGKSPFEYNPEKVWFPIEGGKETYRTGYIGLQSKDSRLPE